MLDIYRNSQMVNPFSTIILSYLNMNRQNHQHQTQHQSQQLNEANYFLSYGSLILGTGTVMLSTFIISYYFNLKPYTYLKSAVSTISYILAEDVNNSKNNIINDDHKNKYENKYFDEYDAWLETKKATPVPNPNPAPNPALTPTDTENLDNMYYLTIKDTINETYGDIIMCYDNATQSFAYYAKTANIPYKYLETAARKYVIDTNADASIYIDIRKEFENAKNKNNKKIENSIVVGSETTMHTNTNDKAADDESDLFAKFKSYNTASNIPVNDIHTKKMTALESAVLSSVNVAKPNDGNSNSNTKQHVSILRENANRYSYRGKLADYEIHHENFLSDRRNKANSKPDNLLNITKIDDNNDTNNNNNNDNAINKENKAKMSYQEFKKQMVK